MPCGINFTCSPNR